MNARKILIAATAATLVGGALPAPALLIASDSFGYANGALSGGSGGTGWGAAWTAGGGAQVVDDVLRIGANATSLAYRPLAAPVSANDIYLSFSFQAVAGSVGKNDFAALWFDNVLDTDHTTVPGIGLKGDKDASGASNPDLFARTRLGGEGYSENLTGSRDTYFIVGHLWKSEPGGSYNRFDLWVDPEFGDLLFPEARSATAGTLSSFRYVGFRGANIDPGDQFLFDDLRMGATWGDVVPAPAAAMAPVPEPASLLLLGSGLMGLAAVVRRRRK